MVRAVTESTSTEESTAYDAGPAAGIRWDLSDLYADAADAAIDADLDRALDEARAFAERYRDRVASLDAGEMATAIDTLEALQEGPTGAATYAGLLFAADTANPAHGALLQSVQERSSEIRNTLVFLELEWVAVDEERVRALLSDPVLARRRHLLESMRRYRPHLLSEPEERLLEETANTGERAFSRLFEEILGAARFQVEVDGESTELGEEEVLSLLYDPDREKRRNAARGLTDGLRQHSRTLAFIFNTLVQDKAVRDRLRHYQDPIDSRNLANEIDGASVRALLDACERGHPLVHRYYRLKARWRTTTVTLRWATPPGHGASRRRSGSCWAPSEISHPPWRRSPGDSSQTGGSTQSCGRASGAAPSRHRRCRAPTPTCCSITPAICAT
jgi:oligoendopeptidase F